MLMRNAVEIHTVEAAGDTGGTFTVSIECCRRQCGGRQAMAADEGLRSGMDNLEGTLNSVAECATLGVVARELSSNQFRDLRARHAQTKWAAEVAS